MAEHCPDEKHPAPTPVGATLAKVKKKKFVASVVPLRNLSIACFFTKPA